MVNKYHNTISLIFLQGLGNSIINFPIYHAMSRFNNVQVITFKNGSSAFYQELGAEVIEISNLRELITKSYKNNSDVGVSLHPNWRRELVSLNLIKSSSKYHFLSTSALKDMFLGKRLGVDREKHDLENNNEILKEMKIPESDYLAEFDKYLFKKNESEKYIVIHPTASTSLKYYPVGFWQKIIESLSLTYGKIFILSGKGNQEQEYAKQLLVGNAVLAIGLPFDKLFQIIGNCDLFLGLDSSMMHLAALLKKRVICLWSYADLRRIYPYSPDVHIYVPKLLSGWQERANPQIVLGIIQGNEKPNLRKTDMAKNDIKLSYF
jgi:ADP-heptose:LPS heptosyltransferase